VAGTRKDIVENKADVSPADELAKVTGKVLVDGLPLSDADVHLVPRGDPADKGVSGRTASDGGVEWKEIKPGSYLVLISKRVQKNGASRNLLLEKYGDKVLSPLRVEIQKGNNSLVFDVKREPEDKKTTMTIKVQGEIRAEGKPLAGAEIRLVPEDDLNATGYKATVDADGNFLVEVAPGRYVGVIVKTTTDVPDAWKDPKRSPYKFDFTKLK
jgi:hypothetical protein